MLVTWPPRSCEVCQAGMRTAASATPTRVHPAPARLLWRYHRATNRRCPAGIDRRRAYRPGRKWTCSGTRLLTQSISYRAVAGWNRFCPRIWRHKIRMGLEWRGGSVPVAGRYCAGSVGMSVATPESTHDLAARRSNMSSSAFTTTETCVDRGSNQQARSDRTQEQKRIAHASEHGPRSPLHAQGRPCSVQPSYGQARRPATGVWQEQCGMIEGLVDRRCQRLAATSKSNPPRWRLRPDCMLSLSVWRICRDFS